MIGKRGKHMHSDIIRQTVKLWTDEPEKAQASPVVKARTDGSQAVLEAGPFSWRTDLPPPLGGAKQAPSPTAFLLGSLAGCAAVFIHDTLAPQLGLRVDSVQAEVRCKTDFRGLLGIPGTVPDLHDLEIRIQIQSPEPKDQVQALYRAWLERCPVYLALTKPLSVKTSLIG
jgi:uncharacterized OsmC-like protein